MIDFKNALKPSFFTISYVFTVSAEIENLLIVPGVAAAGVPGADRFCFEGDDLGV